MQYSFILYLLISAYVLVSAFLVRQSQRHGFTFEMTFRYISFLIILLLLVSLCCPQKHYRMSIFLKLIKMPVDLVSCKVSLLVSGGLSPSLPTKTPILLDQVPRLMTSFNLSYPLKAPSPNTAALGVRVSVYEFQGDTGYNRVA